MSKRVVWLVAVGIGMLATACMPVSTAPQSDNPLVENAQNNAWLTVTAQVAAQQAAQGTADALKEQGKTDREIALIMAPVSAKATELELSIRAGNATSTSAVATSTQQAANSTATQSVSMNSANATATREAQIGEQNRAWSDQIFWGLAIAISLAVVIYLSYQIAKHWELEKNKRENEKVQVEVDRKRLVPINGIIYWLPPGGGEPRRMDGATTTALAKTKVYNAAGDGFIPFEEGNGKKSSGSGSQQNLNNHALDLVQKGIDLWGESSLQIPGWREMRWTPSHWQWVTQPMKDLKMIWTDNQGTFLKERGRYANLGALRDALEDGKLVFSLSTPLPLPVAGD